MGTFTDLLKDILPEDETPEYLTKKNVLGKSVRTPLVKSGTLTGNVSKQEIAAIAKANNVNPDWLEAATPYYGGSVEGDKDSHIIAKTLSIAGDIMGGIPQFISKKLEDEPQRKAIDDLREVINKRQPLKRTGVELLGGLATGGALLKTAAKAPGIIGAGAKAIQEAPTFTKMVAEVLPQSAAMGLAESKEGEEIKGLGKGTLMGTALVGTMGAGMAGFKTAKTLLSKLPKETANQLSPVEARAAIDKLGIEGLSSTIKNIRSPLISDENIEFNALKKYLNGEKLTLNEIDSVAQVGGITSDNPEKLTQLVDNRIKKTTVKLYKAAFGTTPKNMSEDKIKSKLLSKLENEGEDFVKRSYDGVRNAEVIKKSIALTSGDESTHGFPGFFSSNRVRAENIENRNKVVLAPIIDDLSESISRAKTFSNMYTQKLGDVDAIIKKSGLTDSDVFNYLNGKAKQARGNKVTLDEDNAIKSIKDPEQLSAIKSYQSLMKDMKNVLEESTGLKIRDYGEFYVPNKVKRTEDLLLTMQNKAKDLGVGDSLLTPEAFDKLKNSDGGEDFIKALAVITGKSIDTAPRYNQWIGKIYNPDGAFARNMSDASSIYKREGEIPEFILDKNAIGAASRWINSVGQHAFKRDDLQAMRDIQMQLGALGQTKDAKWLGRLIADNSGGTAGVISNMTKGAIDVDRLGLKWAMNMRKAEQAATNPLAKEWYRDLHDVPQLLGTLLHNFHSNILGTSTKALFNNLTQPVTTTVPGIGYGLGMKAIQNSMETIKPGIEEGVGKWMVRRGYSSGEDAAMRTPDFTNGIKEGLKQGLRDFQGYKVPTSEMTQGKVSKVIQAGTDIVNKASYLYSQVEKSNRFMIANIGESLGDLLIKGDKEAWDYFSKYGGRGYQERLSPLIRMAQSGDENAADEVKNIMGKYLVSKTSFNYDKASASEFARALGPILTQFTKWPIEVASDLVGTMYNPNVSAGQAALKLSSKYLTPFLFMYGIHQGMKAADMDKNKYYQAVAGKGPLGAAGSTPITSVLPIVSGGLFTPPVLQTGTKVVKRVFEDPRHPFGTDTKGGWLSPLRKMVPGEYIYRILED